MKIVPGALFALVLLFPAFSQSLGELETRAAAGDAQAMTQLGYRFGKGLDGTDQDYGEAMKWFRLAASKGDARAMYYIGALYADGSGVAQNCKEAMKWFQFAADKGQVQAMGAIGKLYAFGCGVAQDMTQAARWYQLAAGRGDPTAMSELGSLYLTGTGVRKNPAEAKKWLLAAANKGETGAMVRLGLAYALPEFPRNDAESYYWLSLACLNDDSAGSEKRRDAARSQLSGTAADAVDARVEKWRLAHPLE
jgi:uncharacterized protein